MLKRFWRLLTAIFGAILRRSEGRHARDIRNQIIDEKVGQVAEAQKGLGELAGAVRLQTREVGRLEEEQSTVQRRKDYFKGQLKKAEPGSPAAVTAKENALVQHRELTQIVEALNAARQELARLANEYEASKQLICQAQTDVKEAKRKGRRLDQRARTAQRRAQLVETTSSLRGLRGVGDELVDLDESVEAEIAALEGAAFVAADLASAELAERRLDAEIALADTDAEFEREMAELEADTSEVIDVTPKQTALPESTGAQQEVPVPEPELEKVPVSRSTSSVSDFGSSDSGSSDFGGSDFGDNDS